MFIALGCENSIPSGHLMSKSPQLFLCISDSGLGVLRHFQRPRSFIMDTVGMSHSSWDFCRDRCRGTGRLFAAECAPLYANNNTVLSNSCPQSTALHLGILLSIIFSKPFLPSCPVEIRDCLKFSQFYTLLYAEMIELIPNSYKYNTLIHPCIP